MNDNQKRCYVTDAECLLRRGHELLFVGLPDNPLKIAVDRCNAGTATEEDLDALSALPVFDHDVLETGGGFEIFENFKRR